MSESESAGRRWLGGALCLAALALAGASLLVIPQERYSDYFKVSAYPFYALAFGWAIWAWLREDGPTTWSDTFGRYRWALLACALVGLHIAFTVPMGFRVLGDEGTLLSTAKSLYFERLPVAVKHSLFIDGVYTDELSAIVKRPVGFPFFVSLLHDIFGYRYYNGFAANIMLAVLTGLAFHRLCRIFYPPAVSIAGIIVLASFPIFKLSATSGGFEIVNLFLILITVCDFASFAEKPTPHKLTRSLLTFVLLSQIRYESVLYAGLAAPFYLSVMGRRCFDYFLARNALLPFLMLPVAWQRIALLDHTTLQVPEHAALFSWSYLTKHLVINTRFFAGWRADYPVAGIVFYLALAGALYWIWTYWKRERNVAAGQRRNALLIGTYALFQLIFHSAYYWGSFRYPAATRFSLVLVPWLVLPALFLIAAMFERLPSFRGRSLVPIALALGVYFAYQPLAEKGTLHQEMVVPREVGFVTKWLVEQPDFERALVISDRPEAYSVYVHSIIPLDHFRSHPKEVEQWLRDETFSGVYVMQRASGPQGNPIPEHGVPRDFSYEIVERHRLSPKLSVRILRVKPKERSLPEEERS